MYVWAFESACERLRLVAAPSYPLCLTKDDAHSLLGCIQRIMAAVPEANKPDLVPLYQLATEAIWHPFPAEAVAKGRES